MPAFPTQPVIRTVYAAHLQTCLVEAKPFYYHPNSTLNEKFSVRSDYIVPAGIYPSFNMIAIGNRGSRLTLGPDGTVLTDPVQHLPRHASLYRHIPFIMREATNDLSATERSKYRMRVIEKINNVDYVVYYLKVLDKSATEPDIELRSVDGSNISSVPFVPSQSDLFPEHPPVTSQTTMTVNGDYLASVSYVPFVLGEQDIYEIIEACRIKFGDARYAVIDEMAICSGIDELYSVLSAGQTITYNESMATQISAFYQDYRPLNETTTEINMQIVIGGVEPLLV